MDWEITKLGHNININIHYNSFDIYSMRLRKLFLKGVYFINELFYDKIYGTSKLQNSGLNFFSMKAGSSLFLIDIGYPT